MPPLWFDCSGGVGTSASNNTACGAWAAISAATNANTTGMLIWEIGTRIPLASRLQDVPTAPPTPPRPRAKPTPEAERVAMATLREMLSRDEWRSLRRDRRITVPSKLHPAQMYVVTEKARVLVQEGGKTVEALCFHPPDEDELPMGDRLLTRVFLLQYDEERVLRAANRHAPDGWYARGDPMPAMR